MITGPGQLIINKSRPPGWDVNFISQLPFSQPDDQLPRPGDHLEGFTTGQKIEMITGPGQLIIRLAEG
jgi:hypothetical protein